MIGKETAEALAWLLGGSWNGTRDKDAARRAATACLAPVPNSTRKPGPRRGIAKNAAP